MGYGTAQRCAFAGLVIGFLLCATGTCAPFWNHGEIDVNTLTQFFSVSIPFFGSTKLATIDTGLWWYCREYLDDKKCEFYKIKQDDSAKIWTCRVASVVSILLSLICALVGLCRTCCCPGGKTILHGVIAFLAGGAGIVTIAVFVTSNEEDNSLLKMETSYAWAFYVYIAGTAIIVFVSFLLCFAAPDNSVAQVFHGTATGGTVVVANSTHQTQSFGTPQYAYPNAMYTGPSTAMYPEQHQPTYFQQPPNHPFSTQPQNPQINNEDMSKHHGWD